MTPPDTAEWEQALSLCAHYNVRVSSLPERPVDTELIGDPPFEVCAASRHHIVMWNPVKRAKGQTPALVLHELAHLVLWHPDAIFDLPEELGVLQLERLWMETQNFTEHLAKGVLEWQEITYCQTLDADVLELRDDLFTSEVWHEGQDLLEDLGVVSGGVPTWHRAAWTPKALQYVEQFGF